MTQMSTTSRKAKTLLRNHYTFCLPNLNDLILSMLAIISVSDQEKKTKGIYAILHTCAMHQNMNVTLFSSNSHLLFFQLMSEPFPCHPTATQQVFKSLSEPLDLSTMFCMSFRLGQNRIEQDRIGQAQTCTHDGVFSSLLIEQRFTVYKP